MSIHMSFNTWKPYAISYSLNRLEQNFRYLFHSCAKTSRQIIHFLVFTSTFKMIVFFFCVAVGCCLKRNVSIARANTDKHTYTHTHVCNMLCKIAKHRHDYYHLSLQFYGIVGDSVDGADQFSFFNISFRRADIHTLTHRHKLIHTDHNFQYLCFSLDLHLFNTHHIHTHVNFC